MKKLFLTVDVECHNLSELNSYVYGKVGNKYYGIQGIIDIATEFSIPVNFFIDIAEVFRYGDDVIKDIINIIRSQGHSVYFHLHPNYISGDDDRTYFWQYSTEEQKVIFNTALDKYKQLLKIDNCVVFRMGRYGVDINFYKMLKEQGISLIDLSYCYQSKKMCKIKYDEVKTINIPTYIYDQVIIPNTRYIGLQYKQHKYYFGLDVSETCYSEFCDVICKSNLGNVVLTMHSWSLINRYFFINNYITINKNNINKLKKMINFSQKIGYIFSDLKDFTIVESVSDDYIYNPFEDSIIIKLRYYYYNLIRIFILGKLNIKYLSISMMIVIIGSLSAAIIIMLLLYLIVNR